MRNSFLPYFIHACTANDKKKNYPVTTLALIPVCESVCFLIVYHSGETESAEMLMFELCKNLSEK